MRTAMISLLAAALAIGLMGSYAMGCGDKAAPEKGGATPSTGPAGMGMTTVVPFLQLADDTDRDAIPDDEGMDNGQDAAPDSDVD